MWPDSVAVLARVGSAIPIGKPRQTTCRAGEDPEFPGMEKDDWRGVEILPIPQTSRTGNDASNDEQERQMFKNAWLEDDGESPEGLAAVWTVELSYSANPSDITVEAGARVPDATAACWSPLWLSNGLTLVLPVGEERPISRGGGGGNETN